MLSKIIVLSFNRFLGTGLMSELCYMFLS